MQRLLDRDLVTGLVLLCIYSLFIADSSADPKDWIFPILANYVILVIGILLLARGAFALFVKRLPDILHLTLEERLALTDWGHQRLGNYKKLPSIRYADDTAKKTRRLRGEIALLFSQIGI